MGEETLPTWEQLHEAIANICEEKGWHHGVPVPSSANVNAKIIMAKGCPLSENRENIPTNLLDLDVEDNIIARAGDGIVNSWFSKQTLTLIVKDNLGSFKLRVPQDEHKLRIHLDSAMLRVGAMSANAELTAMGALFKTLNNMQKESYILNGMFPETSKRSGVTYIFRKGLPTLALRIERLEDKKERRHFLAALCQHPLAYYADTFAGCTPPTDEVLTHLLMMRSDEHRFWKKSGQHPLNDWRSGI